MEHEYSGIARRISVAPTGKSAAPAWSRTTTDEDLIGGLTALVGLTTPGLSLADQLTTVALSAVQAIPGADGAGLTLLEQDRADTIVSTAPFVREVDDIQYLLGEGPCISAATTGQTFRSGSLGGDHRWPRFGARVGRLDVHSVLSLPLLVHDQTVGAMNIYAHTKNAFDDRAEHLARLFADPAAIAVQHAQLLDRTRRLAENLHNAVTTQRVVDQAIGVIISRTGNSPQQAFQLIRTRSEAERQQMSVVAAGIVEEAVRTARERTGRT